MIALKNNPLHECTDICSLTKKYYPETWMQHHGFEASLVKPVENKKKSLITIKRLVELAKETKIKNFRRLKSHELAEALEARQSGNETRVSELEQLGRERS